MTLDKVIVDLSEAFEASQIYVARKSTSFSHGIHELIDATVSRARSLKGLKVTGLPRRRLGGGNVQVKEFFQKYLTKKPASASVPPSSQVLPSSQ